MGLRKLEYGIEQSSEFGIRGIVGPQSEYTAGVELVGQVLKRRYRIKSTVFWIKPMARGMINIEQHGVNEAGGGGGIETAMVRCRDVEEVGVEEGATRV